MPNMHGDGWFGVPIERYFGSTSVSTFTRIPSDTDDASKGYMGNC